MMCPFEPKKSFVIYYHLKNIEKLPTPLLLSTLLLLRFEQVRFEQVRFEQVRFEQMRL
jgi:hypothetical protein